MVTRFFARRSVSFCSVVLAIALLGVEAQANPVAGTVMFATAPRALKSCRSLKACGHSEVTSVTLATRRRSVPEVRPLLPRLLDIAVKQAEFWDDSILGSSYEADATVVLDRVEGLFHQEELIAFRITYSSRAWRIGVGGVRVEEGRIVESSFVSASLHGFFRDEQAVAEFRPGR